MWVPLTLLLLLLINSLSIHCSPTTLNVVLIGFHRVDSGFVSDVDLARSLPSFVTRSTSMPESAHDQLVEQFAYPDKILVVDAHSALKRLLSTTSAGGGFTLFVLNLKMKPHVYCADLKCGCPVNAWITNDRFAWIDLSADRAVWGNRLGPAFPNAPEYEMSLGVEKERAEHALKGGEMEGGRFLDKWKDALLRVVNDKETDFNKAHEIVTKASDELEEIMARKFVMANSSSTLSWDRFVVPCPSVEFLAHLSNVVKSFTARVLFPVHTHEMVLDLPQTVTSSHESFKQDFASRVVVHLYVVRGHEDASDTGPTDADIEVMRHALGKLEFKPLQTFEMAVHRLDMDTDIALLSAFVFSQGSMVTPVIIDGKRVGITRRYVDAKDFRNVLLSEKESTPSNFHDWLAHKPGAAASESATDNLELPVFWFYGVDSSKDPLYVDGFHRAVDLSDMVVVVESKHAAVERVDAWCGSKRVVVDASKPLRAAVLATARLWWKRNSLRRSGGMDNPFASVSPVHNDWSWAVGAGDAMGLTLFENIDETFLLSNVFVDAFHRSTVIDSAAAAKRLLAMVDRKSKQRRVGPLSAQLIKARDDVRAAHHVLVECAAKNDWICSSRNVYELLTKIKALAKELAGARASID